MASEINPSPRLIIFIDGWCTYCTRFARFVKRCDKREAIQIKNIREDKDPRLDYTLSLQALASISSNGKVSYGYTSIYHIIRLLPPLWIFLPFGYLLNVTGLGQWLYRELAIRRKIIPLHCEQEECSRPQKS